MTITARCEGRTNVRHVGAWGEEQALCTRTLGLLSWTDVDGKEHHACPHHVGGLKRRWPSELPERTAQRGTVGLASPYARAKFPPAERIAVENSIPENYRINVIPYQGSRSRFVVVGCQWPPDGRGAMYPVELFRSEPTADPYRVALAMCERLALHAWRKSVAWADAQAEEST